MKPSWQSMVWRQVRETRLQTLTVFSQPEETRRSWSKTSCPTSSLWPGRVKGVWQSGGGPDHQLGEVGGDEVSAPGDQAVTLLLVTPELLLVVARGEELRVCRHLPGTQTYPHSLNTISLTWWSLALA